MRKVAFCLLIFLTGMGLFAKKEEIQGEISAAGATGLKIDHAHGDIQVHGWDRDEVSFKGSKRGTGTYESDLDEIRVELSRQGDRVLVKLQRPSRKIRWGSGELEINYELFAPRNLVVELEVRHGNTSISDFQKNVRVNGAHGNFDAVRIAGSMNVDWAHGGLAFQDVGGDLKLVGSHGRVRIENLSGKLDAEISHGGLTARNIGDGIDVQTAHGDVSIVNDDEPRADYSISATHGSIKLDIPEDSGIDLSMDVTHGSFSGGRNLKVRGEGNSSSLKQSLNSGGVAVRLSAQHGDIRLF